MIENFRTHPYTRAVCLETARLFERQATKDLVEAQCLADEGALDRAREVQTRARLAQQRANRVTVGQPFSSDSSLVGSKTGYSFCRRRPVFCR